jgi:hypothetical protein
MPASAGEVPDRAAEELALEPDDDPEAALWAALSAAPAEGISVPELVTASDMSRRWVYYRLRELAAAGRVVQTARQACVCTTRDQQNQETPKVAHIGSIIVVRAYD